MEQCRGHRRALLVVGISVAFALACDARQNAQRRSPDVQRELHQYLTSMADSGFAFSALVALDGNVVLQKGYGWLDSLQSKPADERSLFNIASITKSFTACGIFQLMEKKLLSLNDSLPKFFPHVPGDKKAITITQLLTHASGLAQHYVADGVTERDSAVGRILNDTLKFMPGTSFSYSNENYELLGAIIEIVARQTYEQFIRTSILTPARMTDTRFWAEAAGPDGAAIASKNRELEPQVMVRNWGYIASGGIYSNVVDLYRWFTAVKRGAIVEMKTVEQMWSVERQPGETGIASGWFVSASAAGREVWTRGTEDWGHNGVLRWFPDRKVLIIVLSNSGERGDKNVTANRTLSDGIMKILFQ